jgi:hypothetical protein
VGLHPAWAEAPHARVRARRCPAGAALGSRARPSGANPGVRRRASRRRPGLLAWLAPVSPRCGGALAAAPPPSRLRAVIRWAPRPPGPFDARHPAHGDCRPPPAWGAGVSPLAWRRLRRDPRWWPRIGVTCSGRGSRRRPFSPSADGCPPLGNPLSLPRLRPVHRSPRVRRVTFHPSPPPRHRSVPEAMGRWPPTRPHPRGDASQAVRGPRVRRVPPAAFRSPLAMGTLAVRLGGPGITAAKGRAPSRPFPVGFRLPVASASHGAARHAWRTPGS